MMIDPLDADIFHSTEKTLSKILEETKGLVELKDWKCKGFFTNSQICAGIIYQLGESTLSDILDDIFIEELNRNTLSEINEIIRNISITTKGILSLEAIRANSQRMYSNQSQGTTFNELLANITNDWCKENTKKPSILFLNKWLKKFGIGDNLIINRIKGIATEIIIKKESKVVDLIDLGYGATQFLPILMFIALKFNLKPGELFIPVGQLFTLDELENIEANEEVDVIGRKGIHKMNGPLLLIEEPESNLHPKLQSLLADFFIDVAKTFEVTLLIETHSEYLIRRISSSFQLVASSIKPGPKSLVRLPSGLMFILVTSFSSLEFRTPLR